MWFISQVSEITSLKINGLEPTNHPWKERKSWSEPNLHNYVQKPLIFSGVVMGFFLGSTWGIPVNSRHPTWVWNLPKDVDLISSVNLNAKVLPVWGIWERYIISDYFYDQIVANWWFGLVVWIPRIPLWKGLLLRGTTRIPSPRKMGGFSPYWTKDCECVSRRLTKPLFWKRRIDYNRH